ncbi:flagellar hook-length control protein FliK [Parasedimentitalea marina]|uniref:flagellar hook-length control protein FliK n=1 Tax=Parasedimentitalea marina TaxID=2483033 RepID=UPI0013E28E7D|nr:flagellar hook-length control protein FliK [Parasedimentitalea marina]
MTSSAANVNGNVTTAQEKSGLAVPQAGLADKSVANKVVRPPVHRSIAELRMTGPQPGTVAERQPMQATVAGQPGPMVEKTPGSSPQETPPTAIGTDAGQKAETIGAAVKAGQTTPEVQAAQQTTTTNTPRRAKVSQPGIAANTQGIAGVATHQAAGQNLPDGLQSVMKPLPEEQAAPVREAASEEVEVKTNIQPIRKATGPVSNATVQVQQVLQSAAIGQVAVVNAEALTDPLGVNLALDSTVFEPAGLSQLLTEAVMSPGTTHRPETPRLVAVQLAEALAAKGERNIDVALSPEELGRVKMRVSTTESSVVVTITTERPETGDLMRRHIDELSEEFRRMGFEDISFEFGGEGMPGDGSEQRDSLDSGSSGASDGSPIADNVQEAAQQNLRLGESGLDMRI